MTMVMRISAVMVTAALVVCGCGRSDEPPPSFNEPLGDSMHGLPFATGPIDVGILEDPASYRPARFEPLEGAAPAQAVAEAGPEAQAAKELIDEAIDNLFQFDLLSLLDTCVPDQVAALQEDPCGSALSAFGDAIDTMMTVSRKMATPEEAQLQQQLADAMPALAESIKKIVSVTLIDEDNAVATFDFAALELPTELLDALRASQEFALQKARAMGAAPPGPGAAGRTVAVGRGAGRPAADEDAPTAEAAPGGMPGAGEMMSMSIPPEQLKQMLGQLGSFAIPLTKVDGDWYIKLPVTFNEEHADLLANGLEIINTGLGRMAQAIENAGEEADQAQLMMAIQKIGTDMTMQLMGWWGQAQPVLAELMEQVESGGQEKPATTGGEQEEEPNAPAPSPRPRP